MSKIFKVWPTANGETDHVEIRAYDAQEAAQLWALREDSLSNEYAIVNGNPVEVSVLGDEEKVPHEYIVSGEAVRQYQARLIVAGGVE